jgi:hypothetical protein
MSGDGFATEREKGAGSREKKEGRRADVGNPAGQEQGYGRLSEIGRTDPRRTEEIPDMIERHEDHDNPSKRID